MRKALFVVVIILLLVLLRMSFFTVDGTELVYVTELGQHVATYDGGDSEHDAGLHWRWPWPIQVVQRLDRRLQFFDLPVTEVLTRDEQQPRGPAHLVAQTLGAQNAVSPGSAALAQLLIAIREADTLAVQRIGKTLVVETYACWRIAGTNDLDRFIRRIGTPEQARTILTQRINSQLSALLAKKTLGDLISTRAGQVETTLAELHRKLVHDARDEVRKEYGIDLVDVRLRRFNHPEAVREANFQRIRSERAEMAEKISSKAATEASNIVQQAEEEARRKLAQARFEEETLRGQADAEATLIRNQAQVRDPELYVFLKKMEKLHNILVENKTLLLLSTHRSLFDLLFQPPYPNGAAQATQGKGPSRPNDRPEPKEAPRIDSSPGQRIGPDLKKGGQ
jgi:membrane protease subunit HflC